MRGQHRRPRRRLRILGTAIATLGVVAAGFTVSTASGEDQPERLLQSVRVDLGADATLYGIDATNVRKISGKKPTSDTNDYAPGKYAGELPVRVLTSYRTARGSGADLTDLKGYDGRVRIDITVLNTTMRPERLTYDGSFGAESRYALVGVPLTVTAAAGLNKDDVARVVTTAEDGTEVTNGVVSQRKDKTGSVQWAALLSPPQLAPSTTFTLVMNAHDFELPDISIGVQTGLSAEPSLEALLGSAFSSDGPSQLALESRTIAMVGDVTTILAEAANQLQRVRAQLDYSTDTLGTKTIASLTSGTRTVAASTKSYASELEALASSLDAALATTKSAALQQLADSVRTIRALLGDTSASTATPKLTGSGCATRVAGTTGTNTVYGQLSAVATQLVGLADATGACRDQISAALLRTIGSVTGGKADCPVASGTTAICAVQAVINELGSVPSLFGGIADSAAASLRAATLDQVKSALEALVTSVVDAQTTAHNMASGQPSDPLSTLRALLSAYQTAGNDLQAARDSLATVFGSVHDRAVDQASQVGGTGVGSMADQAAALKQRLCALDTTGTVTPADIGKVLALVSATDCTGATLNGPPTGFADPLETRLLADRDAWQQVADDTDPAVTTSMAGDALAKLDAVIATMNNLSVKAGPIRRQVNDLADTLDQLYDASATAPTCAGAGTGTAPLNVVVDQFTTVSCQQDAAIAALRASLQQAGQDVTALVPTLQTQQGVIDGTRRTSDTALTALFQAASGELDSAATSITSTGKQAINAQSAKLDAETSRFTAALNIAVLQAMRTIDAQVGSSTQNITAAENLLLSDLRSVLTDLGSRHSGGSGLLGVIAAQSAQTRTSTAHLGTAYSTASAFGGIRGADLDGIYLARAQLSRGLELQSTYPPFAVHLPQGSSHVTVYSFHLRGDQ